jgi:hypothetical protein
MRISEHSDTCILARDGDHLRLAARKRARDLLRTLADARDGFNAAGE